MADKGFQSGSMSSVERDSSGTSQAGATNVSPITSLTDSFAAHRIDLAAPTTNIYDASAQQQQQQQPQQQQHQQQHQYDIQYQQQHQRQHPQYQQHFTDQLNRQYLPHELHLQHLNPHQQQLLLHQHQPQQQQQHQQQQQYHQQYHQRHQQNESHDGTSVNCNLIVNYLPHEVDDNALRQLFEEAGPILTCKVVRDKNTKKSLGYGFVKFVEERDASIAIQRLNGYTVGHKVLKVSVARPPSLEIKNCKLYITNLPKEFSEREVVNLFAAFGEIIECRVLRERNSVMNKGVAFVQFNLKSQADAALRMNGCLLEGTSRPLIVKYAEDQHKKRDVTHHGGFAQEMDPSSYNQAGGGNFNQKVQDSRMRLNQSDNYMFSPPHQPQRQEYHAQQQQQQLPHMRQLQIPQPQHSLMSNSIYSPGGSQQPQYMPHMMLPTVPSIASHQMNVFPTHNLPISSSRGMVEYGNQSFQAKPTEHQIQSNQLPLQQQQLQLQHHQLPTQLRQEQLNPQSGSLNSSGSRSGILDEQVAPGSWYGGITSPLQYIPLVSMNPLPTTAMMTSNLSPHGSMEMMNAQQSPITPQRVQSIPQMMLPTDAQVQLTSGKSYMTMNPYESFDQENQEERPLPQQKLQQQEPQQQPQQEPQPEQQQLPTDESVTSTGSDEMPSYSGSITLLISNLPTHADVEMLHEIFKPFGRILSAEIDVDPKAAQQQAATGTLPTTTAASLRNVCSGRGRVQMASIESAQHATHALDGTVVSGASEPIQVALQMNVSAR